MSFNSVFTYLIKCYFKRKKSFSFHFCLFLIVFLFRFVGFGTNSLFLFDLNFCVYIFTNSEVSLVHGTIEEHILILIK